LGGKKKFLVFWQIETYPSSARSLCQLSYPVSQAVFFVALLLAIGPETSLLHREQFWLPAVHSVFVSDAVYMIGGR
jgi:hypothetical protein